MGQIGFGCWIDFATNMPDEKAVTALRGLQRKISSGHRYEVLRDNARIPAP